MSENLFSKIDKPKFSHIGHLYLFDKRRKSDPLLLFSRRDLKTNVNSKQSKTL